MLKKIRLSIIGLVLFSPIFCQAGAYTVQDMIDHFNLIDTEVKAFDVESCERIPWLQKGICQEAIDKISNKLAKVSPYIGKNELVYRDHWAGSEKYGSKTYVTKKDILFKLDGDSLIDINNDGLAVEDVFLPYIARLYISASVSGDGDGHIRNRLCIAPSLLFGCQRYTYSNDSFDIDFFGTAKFDIVAGLALNAKVIETPDEYILALQPIFRLLARESDVTIDYNVDGISIFTSAVNLINIGESAIDLNNDLMTFNFDSAIEEFLYLNESGIISMASLLVFTDDLTDDAIFKMASEITTSMADDELDKQTNRILYEQEQAINAKIKKELGLDEFGLVAYHLPKPKIHGRSFAEIVPAINLINL